MCVENSNSIRVEPCFEPASELQDYAQNDEPVQAPRAAPQAVNFSSADLKALLDRNAPLDLSEIGDLPEPEPCAVPIEVRAVYGGAGGALLAVLSLLLSANEDLRSAALPMMGTFAFTAACGALMSVLSTPRNRMYALLIGASLALPISSAPYLWWLIHQ
eukprot:CAMPEP_0185832766 /NCGR_PEP_ID=MMETSP1353-20130828/2282_1 /TAXON_ID=1077150 /ORGANISM="Erythrolobus australicus, Strain CCMP3124" /LENGTH=159 /DNA_ID=CAMNT_0028530989 /DNA_START=80 /DNA_END=559 /DNA_ORIENTATION=-